MEQQKEIGYSELEQGSSLTASMRLKSERSGFPISKPGYNIRSRTTCIQKRMEFKNSEDPKNPRHTTSKCHPARHSNVPLYPLPKTMASPRFIQMDEFFMIIIFGNQIDRLKDDQKASHRGRGTPQELWAPGTSRRACRVSCAHNNSRNGEEEIMV